MCVVYATEAQSCYRFRQCKRTAFENSIQNCKFVKRRKKARSIETLGVEDARRRVRPRVLISIPGRRRREKRFARPRRSSCNDAGDEIITHEDGKKNGKRLFATRRPNRVYIFLFFNLFFILFFWSFYFYRNKQCAVSLGHLLYDTAFVR
ncbi:hypothetical protein PUN28_011532 [Cardiocondyla obscurior]|uniref:Transmembrane protein n=1 Tax=Cardiocondyla obscurior TaxID=286306 RepID=A0AAW2FGI1_9HYME